MIEPLTRTLTCVVSLATPPIVLGPLSGTCRVSVGKFRTVLKSSGSLGPRSNTCENALAEKKRDTINKEKSRVAMISVATILG